MDGINMRFASIEGNISRKRKIIIIAIHIVSIGISHSLVFGRIQLIAMMSIN